MGWRGREARERGESSPIEFFGYARMWYTFGIHRHCKRDRAGLFDMSAGVDPAQC